MGAGASVSMLTCGAISEDCQDFIEVFLPLCGRKAVKARSNVWKSCDNSGNGYVSLAESGKWIQDCLKSAFVEEVNTDTAPVKGRRKASKAKIAKAGDDAKRVYKLFYPSYIRAYLNAADIGIDKKVKGAKTATTDDYVQRKEFRFFCAYLCIYALIYDAFALIDGGGEGRTKDDDRRISLDELVKADRSKFAGHPLLGLQALVQETNVAGLFGKMDADGKGMVLLKEFCEYVVNFEITSNTEFGALLAEDKEAAAAAK